MHERRGNHDVAQAHHAAKVMQWNGELLLVFHVDAQGVVLQVRVGIGRGDVKGVEDLLHVFLSG